MPKQQKTEQPEIAYRSMRADVSIVDVEERRVELSFSSEIEIRREPFFAEPWIEVLGHKPDEVDLERFNTGAGAVLYNHSRTRADRIGGVEKAWIDNGRGKAIIRLSRREDVDDIWGDLEDEILRNVSVGYLIHERELVKQSDSELDVYRITKWEPVELSLVDIPADPSVGVGRTGIRLPPQAARSAPATSHDGDTTMPDKDRQAAIDEGRRLERERCTEIRQAFQFAPHSDEISKLRERCLADDSCSVDDARKLLLEAIGRGKSPSGSPHSPDDRAYTFDGPGRMQLVPNGFRDVATEALSLRCGVKPDNPSPYARDLARLPLVEMIRSCLNQDGVSTSGMSAMQIVGRMTSSDFPSILANATNKIILDGFNDPELRDHREWTAEKNLRDFKPATAAAVSETPALELIPEGGEFKYGKLEETGDTIQVATWGKILQLSRQAIVNDDLMLLEQSARSFGQSAIRLEKDLVFAVLTVNPQLADGTELFHADHNNLGTSGALAVGPLGEARKLLRNQVGLNNESFLDIRPFALVVPTALETTAEQILASIYDPINANQTPTPEFIRRLRLYADPRLDADSETQWYLVANPMSFPWLIRAYIDGMTEPYLEERPGFERDVWEIKVRHDVGVAAVLHQGAVRNAGT